MDSIILRQLDRFLVVLIYFLFFIGLQWIFQEAVTDLKSNQHWDTQGNNMHLNSNLSYRVIEESTRDILVIPVVDTTECVLDIHVPKLPQTGDTEIDREKQAEQIGKAIAEQIEKEEEKQTETTTECDLENDTEENRDKPENEQHPNKHIYKRANKKSKKKFITKKRKDNKRKHYKSHVKHHKHKAPAHFKREENNLDQDAFRLVQVLLFLLVCFK